MYDEISEYPENYKMETFSKPLELDIILQNKLNSLINQYSVAGNCVMISPFQAMNHINNNILHQLIYKTYNMNKLLEWLLHDCDLAHQPPDYWVDLYLENIVRSCILCIVGRPKSSFQCDTANQWFPLSMDRLETDENGKPIKINISVLNFEDNMKISSAVLQKYVSNEKNEGLWYHGTDESSVEKIIEGGLSFRFGHRRQDFSDKIGGFYLSPLFCDAEEWAKTKTTEHPGLKPVVVVFNIKQLLSDFEMLDLSDKAAGNDWMIIVRHFRSGESNACPVSGPLRKKLNNCDCIFGPRGGDGCKHIDPKWKPTKDRKGKEQLCIKSVGLLDVFNRSIESVIAYGLHSVPDDGTGGKQKHC